MLAVAALLNACSDGSGGAGLGAPCADPNAGQSNCAAGLQCAAVSAQNMCSEPCTMDSDCPAGSSCWGKLCWLGCTPGSTAADGGASDGGVCGRSDFLCLSNYAAKPLCAPDCNQEVKSFCASQLFGYPYIDCDDTVGSALYGACLSAGPDCSSSACPSSEACYAIPDSSPAVSTCVEDCTQVASTSCSVQTDCKSGNCINGECQPCGPTFTCSTTTRTCEAVSVGTYAACVATSECPSGDQCGVLVSPAKNECIHSCMASSECPEAPAGATAFPSCDVTDSVCGLDCSLSGATCPSGQTCEPVTDSQGSPMSWCLPVN